MTATTRTVSRIEMTINACVPLPIAAVLAIAAFGPTACLTAVLAIVGLYAICRVALLAIRTLCRFAITRPRQALKIAAAAALTLTLLDVGIVVTELWLHGLTTLWPLTWMAGVCLALAGALYHLSLPAGYLRRWAASKTEADILFHLGRAAKAAAYKLNLTFANALFFVARCVIVTTTHRIAIMAYEVLGVMTVSYCGIRGTMFVVGLLIAHPALTLAVGIAVTLAFFIASACWHADGIAAVGEKVAEKVLSVIDHAMNGTPKPEVAQATRTSRLAPSQRPLVRRPKASRPDQLRRKWRRALAAA